MTPYLTNIGPYEDEPILECEMCGADVPESMDDQRFCSQDHLIGSALIDEESTGLPSTKRSELRELYDALSVIINFPRSTMEWLDDQLSNQALHIGLAEGRQSVSLEQFGRFAGALQDRLGEDPKWYGESAKESK